MQLFFLCLSCLQYIPVTAQSYNYHVLTNRVKQFSKPVRILDKHIDATGNGTVEFTNAKKQVLRFRLNNHKLQILHGRITYQLFYYKKDYLEKIQTFDINGNLAGERESKNESGVVFIIEKPNLYLTKKKLIDDAEGNIDLKDDTNEKIIRLQLYDENNMPIPEFQPTYISSKTYWEYNVRMYWP
ncbi:hypothetical protein IUY40_01385 [Flavobacterium sp. ALJ2]|nr:hypothetical protein [Flavobacterium sp. ALJ2]